MQLSNRALWILAAIYCVQVIYNWSNTSWNFLVFYTSVCISSRPAAFLFLIFVSTMSNSSCVNSPSLMSSWLVIIFMMNSSVTLGDFPGRFLKCSFLKCICSSWLAIFSLALAVLFLLLASFTICHAFRDWIFSIEFLKWLILSWMYSLYSFKYEFVHFVPS